MVKLEMAVPHLWLTAALLLAPFCARCSSSEPVCPQPCSCDRAPVLNCSSSRLSSAPQLVKYSVTELDLSHNLLTSLTFHRPHHNLRRIWLGNNSITHLSLCLERQVGGRYLRHGLGTWSGRGCLTWAPTLQLLSIERNRLERLPEGLDGVEFLQILQLSFNRISILQPGELSHLRQLKELHLHHNLLTHLQPQIFQNLVQLRVLDLSFNMLTSLNPLMYLTLRNIGTDVRLDGNRWQCDCRMSGLQRWMAFDKSRGLRGWSVVCLSPSNLSGRDLQQLEEGDLTCSTTEDSPDRHQDVTVHRGSEILLSCSAQDSVWWTPSGQASGSQHQGGLLISDISEKDVGLYVCVSQEDDTVSVFNLQISEMAGAGKSNPSRTRRQIIPPHTSDKIVEERNQRATQSDLALAVCLSILFTFLIAFILGVLARPYVDALWKRMSKKKTDPAATVATVEQRQYDNMGFSSAEEAVETGPHRERRVTFSSADFGEDIHEPYYDIVASGDQAIVKGNAVIECETAEAKNDMHTAGNSGSENNLRQSSRVDMQIEDSDSDGITVRHNQEFERIPDRTELGERRSLSSSSDSSLSERVSKDKMAKGIHAMPKSPQLAEDTFQQRADSSAAKKVKVSKNSRKDKSQIPGFSSEPFADWSPHTSNRNPTNENSSQDNEELFEFSDSSQSISARSSSVFGYFNYPKEAIKPTSDKDKKGGISSSSSFSSSDNCKEPKQNKIKKEKGKERSTSNNGLLSSMVGAQGGTKKRVAPKPPTAKLSSSSTSGSKEENTDLNVGPHQKETSQTKGYLDVRTRTPSSDSLSSDESAENVRDNRTVHKKKNTRIHDSQEVSAHSSTLWPPLDLDRTTHVKRHLVIKAPSLRSDSSSSSDSENEKTLQEKKKEQVHTSKTPVEGSQTVGHKPENQWPAIDLGYVKRVKKRLDIKAPSASSDSSSSSDSEDDTSGHVGSQRRGILDIGLSLSDSKTQSQTPDGRWPALDLQHIPHESETKNQAADVRGLAVDLQHIVRIKRRLDIKAPTPSSHSSSSSDSEDETTIQKMGNQKLNLPLFNVGITGHSQEGKMGEVNKNPSYSSSSSDDEDPAMKHFNNQTATLETDPNSKWPKVGLSGNLHIKRRLDIKAHFHSPESSSSTEDDVKAEDLRVPKTDRNHVRIIPNVNRRLDIKAPLSQHNQAPSSMLDSQHSESHSSSSESEDEKRDSKAKVELGVTTMFAKRISQSQNQNQNVKLERYTILTDGNKPNADTPEINQDLQKKWADMKLGISRSRKRLEITSKAKEAPSLSSTQPDSPYSSSSDSGSGSRTRVKRRLAAMHEITHTDPTPILKNRPVNVSATSEKLDKYRSLVEIRDRVTDDYSFHGSGEKPKPDPILADFSPPYIGHTVTAPSTPSQKTYSSSSSSSENETVDQSVADLRAGVPRLKRRLNVKAPSPQLSSSQSSSSENENDEVARNSEQSIHSSTHSGRRDDYPIPYKRSIIRGPLVPTNPLTPRGRDQPVDFTKESPMEVDLPLQVRWAGIGRHPSDILLPKPTNVNAGSTYLPQATPTAPKSSPLHPSDSLTITNIVQDSGSPSNKTNEMSESVPEDKKIKRGLGALKAMASERSVWESPLDKDASKGPQDGGSFEIYAKAKSAQPFKQLKLPSASADEKQTGYLLHGMPLYRRHNIRDINPPQEAPPPIPDTPPPDY
ncbi:unnamed protein product [Menidia menidia]|uniref:(Atlantic silverside) hypothetical protein n=1 Tax=Menidia menidia TaxID=238744 RepID=A0A8S4AED2_9TELE|nr:unnamed protein product [Menidia menidia]